MSLVGRMLGALLLLDSGLVSGRQGQALLIPPVCPLGCAVGCSVILPLSQKVLLCLPFPFPSCREFSLCLKESRICCLPPTPLRLLSHREDRREGPGGVSLPPGCCSPPPGLPRDGHFLGALSCLFCEGSAGFLEKRPVKGHGLPQFLWP